MNCEEMLVEQVKKTTEASPGTTVWVYRYACILYRAYRVCRAPCAVVLCVCSACIAVALPILHLPSSCYLHHHCWCGVGVCNHRVSTNVAATAIHRRHTQECDQGASMVHARAREGDRPNIRPMVYEV